MRVIKYLVIVVLLIGLAISCTDRDSAFDDANPAPPEDDGLKMPQKEMRAVWFTTVWNLDIPKFTTVEEHKKHYINTLDKLQELNYNTIIAQVRPKADAFWKSELEPWSTWLAGLGVDPGYDPLEFWIEEAHKRGMELHAWVNPYDITTNKAGFKPAPGSVVEKHPEWTMEYPNTVNGVTYTRIMFRPSHPEVPKYLVKVIKEIADNYDIDGVHFDDYFYPYKDGEAVLDDAEDFKKYGADFAKIEDFRRSCVNSAIEQVSTMLRTDHPGVRFSISPFVDEEKNYNELYADVGLWGKNRWVDFIVPQFYYGTSTITTSSYAIDKKYPVWYNLTDKAPIAGGLGIYRINNTEESAIMDNADLQRQLEYLRRQKSFGSFHYKAGDILLNRGDLQKVLKTMYPTPALIPVVGKTTLPVPAKVGELTLSTNKLTWEPVAVGLRYAIYKISNNRATLIVTTDKTEFELKDRGTYVVSAFNKENSEGAHSEELVF